MRPGWLGGVEVGVVGTPSTDSEGRTTRSVSWVEPVESHAAMLSFDEAELAAQAGMRLDAVALVPLGTGVRVADRIRIASRYGAPLAGVYEVVSVRYTPLHLRVLGRRSEP